MPAHAFLHALSMLPWPPCPAQCRDPVSCPLSPSPLLAGFPPDLRIDAARDLRDVRAAHIDICPKVGPRARGQGSAHCTLGPHRCLYELCPVLRGSASSLVRRVQRQLQCTSRRRS